MAPQGPVTMASQAASVAIVESVETAPAAPAAPVSAPVATEPKKRKEKAPFVPPFDLTRIQWNSLGVRNKIMIAMLTGDRLSIKRIAKLTKLSRATVQRNMAHGMVFVDLTRTDADGNTPPLLSIEGTGVDADTELEKWTLTLTYRRSAADMLGRFKWSAMRQASEIGGPAYQQAKKEAFDALRLRHNLSESQTRAIENQIDSDMFNWQDSMETPIREDYLRVQRAVHVANALAIERGMNTARIGALLANLLAELGELRRTIEGRVARTIDQSMVNQTKLMARVKIRQAMEEHAEATATPRVAPLPTGFADDSAGFVAEPAAPAPTPAPAAATPTVVVADVPPAPVPAPSVSTGPATEAPSPTASVPDAEIREVERFPWTPYPGQPHLYSVQPEGQQYRLVTRPESPYVAVSYTTG